LEDVFTPESVDKLAQKGGKPWLDKLKVGTI
jgi:hypothetical protein